MKQSYSPALWLAFIWLAISTLAIIPLLLNAKPWFGWPASIYGFVTLVASSIAFGFYWWDKRAAKLDRRRIPEKTLHGLAAAGGWPGAVVAQQFLRHKSQKKSFRIALWIIVISHVSLLGCLLYFAWSK